MTIEELRRMLGEKVESFGRSKNWPEMNWSERIANSPTPYTGSKPGNQNVNYNYASGTPLITSGDVAPIGDSVYNSKQQVDTNGGGGNSGDGGRNSGDGGGNSGGGGIDINAIINQQRQARQRVYDEGITRARNAFGQARGIYDEGVSALGKKKSEFEQNYNQGNADILSSYEGERGNLQESDAGNRTRMLNALRAMGMGGSAYLRGEGARQQQNAQQLGNLNVSRASNERANLQGFNANQDWANSQSAALDRYLQGAQESQRAAEAQAGLVAEGDEGQLNQNINGYIQNIIDNQNALAASRSSVGDYSNPFSANLISMLGQLNGQVSPSGETTASSGAGNSVALPTYSINELIKRAGGNMYTAR